MRKNFYTGMCKQVCKKLEGQKLNVISVSEETKQNEDTKEMEFFTRLEVDIPRGFDELSRCRISVKILEPKAEIGDEEVDKEDYIVMFTGLEISYIDDRRNVYFKAKDYVIKKESDFSDDVKITF